MINMHDAFMERIIAEPKEDVHRLAYADWLADEGDSDRAEFIAVQCELAGGKAEPGRRWILQKREEELLAVHRREWAGVAAVLALIASPALKMLRELDVSGFSSPRDDAMQMLLDNSPARFAGLARLHSLKLKDNNITAARLKRLLALPHLAQLQELDLSGNPLLRIGARALAATENLPALQVLRLAGCDLGGDGVMALQSVTSLPKLGVLDIHDNYAKNSPFAMSGPADVSVAVAGKVPLAVRANLAKDNPNHLWVRE